MGQGDKNTSQLRGVHHLLTQGRSDEAEALLAQAAGDLETPAQKNDFAYLCAWCAATQERWEDVVQLVGAFPASLDRPARAELLASGSFRRRRPTCLLFLGDMARELGYYEEALEHYQRCLKLLGERRMNIPEVRLLAHWRMAVLALCMDQPAQALVQYTTALGLCGETSGHPLLATLLTGLCEVHARLDQPAEALAAGQKALQLLQEQAQAGHLEQLLVLLSRVSLALHDSVAALTYAHDAWRVASDSDNPAEMANILLTQAQIYFEGCQMREARAACQQALAIPQAQQDAYLHGTIVFLQGKIAEAEWHCHQDRAELADEAQRYYEEARAIFEPLPQTSSLARVSMRLARFLEARGKPEQALTHWKTAFMLAKQGEDAGDFRQPFQV